MDVQSHWIWLAMTLVAPAIVVLATLFGDWLRRSLFPLVSGPSRPRSVRRPSH